MPPAAPPLRSVALRRERERSWRDLEALLARVEASGIRSLDPDQLARLPVLYRSALSSLGVARTISLDRNALAYLESLAARAYFCVYAPRMGLPSVVAVFLRSRFPRLVRRFGPHLLLAAGILLLGVLAGFLLVRADPDRFYGIVDPAMAQDRTPASTDEQLRGALYGGGGEKASALGAFATFLFTHNTRVGLLCFTLGFLAGVPVFFLMFSNGLVLGAFAALYASRGLAFEFWAWVLPHGVAELTAVALCGAGGLALGEAVVFPGTRTRLANLARVGREAGALFAGTVALFLFAGLVEGIFRQAVHDPAIRTGAALLSAGALAAWFRLRGEAP
ncbi:MAG: stage II sporulation protein M [Planctomycetaceae bacterium]|nr:stage II sporulation protein M [Planctomycetota bacterium]NUN52369.1 stage II sporulation protein M [Planctomycetaceae bacterium]